MTRILILHAAVGAGHLSAAKALGKACALNNIECEVKDILDFSSSVFRKLYIHSYYEISEKAPELWAYWYETADKDENQLINNLQQFMSKLNITGFDNYIQSYNPDIIVCTHFMPLDILTTFKKKGVVTAPIYCVVTDYTGHVFWCNKHIDGYFVGNGYARDKLVEDGINPNIITMTGIPVDPVIAQPKDIEALRKKYHIKHSPVITIMGGGIQTKTVRTIVNDLLTMEIEHASIIVIAGRNKELANKMHDIHAPKHIDLHTLGYIDYVDDIVAMSDVVVTKGGGLIVSELMARHTPMIVVEPIPGQEEWNADYVVSTGVGTQVRLPPMVSSVVEHLVQYPKRLDLMRSCAKKVSKPHAAMDIINAVVKNQKEDRRS